MYFWVFSQYRQLLRIINFKWFPIEAHNSLYHNIPNCQLNRLQQIQNSLVRAVVKAPKSTHITPILKSLHWLKVNERIEYKLLSLSLTKFLQLLNLAIFKTLFLFNLLAVPAPHLLSLFLACQPSPPWKSQIAYYGRPLSVSSRPCYILPMFFIYLFIYFLWPPYFPALVNGSSRKFYTWWTLSGIREVTTWIFSWSPWNYRVDQKSDEIWRIFRLHPQTFYSHARTRHPVNVARLYPSLPDLREEMIDQTLEDRV